MTKSDLIEHLVQKTNLTKKRVEAVVNCMFDKMTESLVNGDRIEIRGFGSWKIKSYAGRMGRNPKTGEPVMIPEKKLPVFKQGKELKKEINAGEKRPIRG